MFHLGLLTRPTSVHPGFVTLEFFPEMYSGLRSFVIWDELHSLRMKEAPVRLYEGLELERSQEQTICLVQVYLLDEIIKVVSSEQPFIC